MKKAILNIYFSDVFHVHPNLVEEYGAFNVSLINDLPLFIDPFLLFNSKSKIYQKLHEEIITYLQFLKEKSISGKVDQGLLRAWYHFGEVKQNWLGFSRSGNEGRGLGKIFAEALHDNLKKIFDDFGSEKIAQSSHLEKVCLIADGVGRDNISDFTTNLIKAYLLEYTQNFAKKHIQKKFRKKVKVERVSFNYDKEVWERGEYELPYYEDDYVLLTPKDILTRDDVWISRKDLVDDFRSIAKSVGDMQLRSLLDNYLKKILPERPGKKDREHAAKAAIREFPQIIDYYILGKEKNGDKAKSVSREKVREIQQIFVTQLRAFADLLQETPYFKQPFDTLEEARKRVMFLKHTIEERDGYRFFYLKKDQPIKRELDLQILFDLTWYATQSDVNKEVNNGRGAADFAISRGRSDKTIIEFKLASNTQLKKNLANQVKIYKKANDTEKSLTVILFFSDEEQKKVLKVLQELELQDDKNIIRIDAGRDGKASASTV